VFIIQPYGNWAAETGPAWRSLDGMKTSDLVLNWYDVSNTLSWERFVLRRGQFLVFDLHDAGSGLLFAKARLPYSTIINKYMATRNEVVTVFVEYDVANEYGGGKLGGVARMHLDLSVNTFVRTKKSAEFWDTHRSEHWTSFPIAPISTGMVRQKYKEIASDYDQQKVVHPCFFGFRVRWRGNPEDEARFTHPMFRGFTLTKKPTPKKLASELSKNMQKDAKPNPWRWDANAAALGRCPVCTDGISGCPRCFMFPLHKTGFPSTPQEFAYDPDRERQKQREAEKKLIKIALKRKRRLDRMKLSAETGQFEEGSLGSMSEEHASDDGDDHSEFTSTGSHYENATDPHMTLHTNLTTYKSIRAYRNVVQKLMTVFVKLVPTGYVRKFVVDPSDTIFHLYNMYNSHSNYGTAHSSMLLIPTIVGMFELHPELAVESDLLMAVSRGRDTLGDYGLRERNGTVVMLFIPNYKKEYVPKYLSTFFEKNTDFSLKTLPMHDTVEKLPPSITGDIVQKYLRGLFEVEYAKQQTDMLREFVQRGLTYHQSRDAKAALNMKQMKERSVEALKEKNAMKLRLESQLKGLTGPERKAAKIALKKRELDKKRSVLYEQEKTEHDARRSEEAAHTRRSKSAGTDGAGGMGILKRPRPESSRSSGSSYSGSSGESESSAGDGTEDGSSSSDSESSSDHSSSSESDDDDERRAKRRRDAKPAVDELESEQDEFDDGPDVESTPVPASPRGGRPRSAVSDRSDGSAGFRRKFYVVDDDVAARGDWLSGSDGSAMEPSDASHSQESGTQRTSLSPASSVTGLSSALFGTGGSSTSGGGSMTSRSHSTYDSRTEYTRSDGTYSESDYSYPTSRSGSSYTTYSREGSDSYTARSYASRASSASSSRSYYSESSTSSYRSGGSGSSGTHSHSSYDSYGSYDSRSSYASYDTASSHTTSYTADSLSSEYHYPEDRGAPHHRGASVHSLFSGLTEPPSVHSSQASGPTVPTLYSGLPPSKSGASGRGSTQEGPSSARSGSSYSSYTSFVYTDSQTSSRSRSNSDSTGGLFTYRSALDSLPSSRSSTSSAYFTRDSPRSESEASRASHSDSYRSASQYSAQSDSRPQSASSSVLSDSTYHSMVSEVSEASSYEAAPSQQSASQEASSAEQRTKSTLFSREYSSGTGSYSTRGGSSYVSYTSDGSQSHSTYSRGSSFRSDGSGGSSHTAPSYDDISMYSSEVRTSASSVPESTRSGSQADDVSETSQSSTGARSLFSSAAESSTANTHPSGIRYRNNQFPVRTVHFEASQETLRKRFEKMKRPRAAVQQAQFQSLVLPLPDDNSSVGSASTATVQVSNFYADGTPVKPPLTRTVTPPKSSQPHARSRDSVSVASSYDSVSSSGSRGSDYRSQSSLASHSRSVESTHSSAQSASTYATERQKRRLMQLHQPRSHASQRDDSSQSQSLSRSLSHSGPDSARSSSADSTYSDSCSEYSDSTGSHYSTSRSQHTADSTITGNTYPSPRTGFVQRKRAHLQHAASFDGHSAAGSTSSGTALSGIHLLFSCLEMDNDINTACTCYCEPTPDPRGSHIMSRGSLGSSTYRSNSDSEFFAFSEDSGSRREASSRRFHSSGDSLSGSQRSGYFSMASSSGQDGDSSVYGNGSGYSDQHSSSGGVPQSSGSESRQVLRPTRPQGRGDGQSAQLHALSGDSGSVGSQGSSSTGTVDYIYRSDVLSSGDSGDDKW
jgi:hypothetical protein